MKQEKNPLRVVQEHGQSIWIDYIRRSLVTSGGLARLIDEDGVSGVTSNPSIFEKAIAGSHEYDQEIRTLALAGASAAEIVRTLTVEDIQRAADLFRPTYERTGGADGFVSLEVSPDLVHDTEGTIEEARRLWAALDRPNAMIKVPATTEGLPAIRRLTADGLNVNITLLFGLRRYEAVADAYLAGLEDRVARGEPVDRISSAASFFLSRIDVLLDPRLAETRGGEELQGQVAVAAAKVAYQMWKGQVASERFGALAAKGARPQRLLWASTSTKNPSYSDVMYIEPLIGPHTVNTVPLETLNAFKDHGDPTPRLEDGFDQARAVLDQLAALGIDLEEVGLELEAEGAEKFRKPWLKLGAAVEERRRASFGERVGRQTLALGALEGEVADRVGRLAADGVASRLWRKDPSLWPGGKAASSLGWLHVAEEMAATLGGLAAFADEVKAAGFTRVVLAGMGGSSLAPRAFARSYSGAGGLPLVVLDTTDPAAVLDATRAGSLEHTLFIVASKSGTTAEPVALEAHFHAALTELLGRRANGNFVAITDPDTPLARRAKERSYRRLFLNGADIGGRYSALSYFGLVPAALLGLDVGELLERALRMGRACAPGVPERENPALGLGAALGELARRGRDKLTFVLPAPLAPLGDWLEQLLAESTGKDGRGVLPVVGEPPGAAEAYGEDRVFVRLRLAGEADGELDRWVDELRRAHPVLAIELDDLLDEGQEMLRWELATAVAGSVLGVDPFDQPNVQEAKDDTARLLASVREGGALPEPPLVHTEGPLSATASPAPRSPGLQGALRELFRDASPGDYAAILAYLPETPETDRALGALRARLRDRLRIATTSGYGPRYLHSTGQYHKGGPRRGRFLELTADDPEDVVVAGERFTFGTLRRAQALGDLEALRRRGRPVVRVHLGPDTARGLGLLADVVEEALR